MQTVQFCYIVDSRRKKQAWHRSNGYQLRARYSINLTFSQTGVKESLVPERFLRASLEDLKCQVTGNCENIILVISRAKERRRRVHFYSIFIYQQSFFKHTLQLDSNWDCGIVLCNTVNYFRLDQIKNIRDPERPETLEELDVLTEDSVKVERMSDDLLKVIGT